MTIKVHLSRQMAEKNISLKELSDKTGVSNVNLSRLKNEHAKMIRFPLLDSLCRILECQPGDLLVHVPNDPEQE